MKRFALIMLILLVVLVVAYITVTVYLRGQVPRYDEYWSRRARHTVPENVAYYVALGDSAAQGIGASKPENGYVGLIAAKTESESGQPVHVINLSKSGAKIRDVISGQVPEMEKITLSADAIVTVVVGANDMSNFDAEKFRQDMDELLQKLPLQAIVADIPYFGGSRASSREKSVLAAHQIIKELATRRKLSLAPLHSVTQDKDSWRVYSIDLFHLSNRGYKNWFDAFWPRVPEVTVNRLL